MSDVLQSLSKRIGKSGARTRRKGRIEIAIDREGKWYYQGTPIERPEMVKLFASALLADEGKYYLAAPEQLLLISVEDLPFIIKSLHLGNNNGLQQIEVTTNCDERFAIGEAHPLELLCAPGSDEKLPAVLVREGLYARFNRNTYYELAGLAEEAQRSGRRELILHSGGMGFSLGSL